MSNPSGMTNDESNAKCASSSLKQAFGIRNARTRLNSGPSDGPTRIAAPCEGCVPVRISLGMPPRQLAAVHFFELALRRRAAIAVDGKFVVALELFDRRLERGVVVAVLRPEEISEIAQ